MSAQARGDRMTTGRQLAARTHSSRWVFLFFHERQQQHSRPTHVEMKLLRYVRQRLEKANRSISPFHQNRSSRVHCAHSDTHRSLIFIEIRAGTSSGSLTALVETSPLPGLSAVSPQKAFCVSTKPSASSTTRCKNARTPTTKQPRLSRD